MPKQDRAFGQGISTKYRFWGIAIILQMRERMEEMQRQIQDFVKYIQQEVLARATAAADPSKGAIVRLRRPPVPPAAATPLCKK